VAFGTPLSFPKLDVVSPHLPGAAALCLDSLPVPLGRGGSQLDREG